ncbi:MAG: DUF2284 domain-containing protein [Oscillospiraceae bacterium]
MDIQRLIDIAKEHGFEVAAPMDVKTLKFLPEVRDMCSADRCHSYNKSWACPPACGTLEEISEKCRQFTHGMLVQTVGKREDEFDFEAIEVTNEAHKKRFNALVKTYTDMGLNINALSAGGCTLCDKCTYPDAPCRFPQYVHPSMEASGLFVSQVCKDNNVPYYYGKDSICFVSCFLFKD